MTGGMILALVGLVASVGLAILLFAFVLAGRRADDFHARLAERIAGRTPQSTDQPTRHRPALNHRLHRPDQQAT